MKTIKVTSCSNCPFFHEDTDGWVQECAYRDEFGDIVVDGQNAAIAAQDKTVPKNCPLKNGGITFKINE